MEYIHLCIIKTNNHFEVFFENFKDGNLLGVGKRYSRTTSKQSCSTVLSHTFNHKICFKYEVYMLVVCGLFLTVKFSCLFTAVAVLACLRSLFCWQLRQVNLFWATNLVGPNFKNVVANLLRNLEIFQGDFQISSEFPNFLLKFPDFLFSATRCYWWIS